MNKSISMLIKLVIFGGLTGLGIIYVINQSPVDSMSTYEKQEMVRPNKSSASSMMSQFFNTKDEERSAADNDDISLMSSSKRYEEVRIGRTDKTSEDQ